MSDCIFNTENIERGLESNRKKNVFNVSDEEGIILLQRHAYGHGETYLNDRELRDSSSVDFASTPKRKFFEEKWSTKIQDNEILKDKQISAAQSLANHRSINFYKPPLYHISRMSPQDVAVARDFIRKDREKIRRESHNRSEKKRRSFINSKIAELGCMLPDNVDRLLCQRKGSILKETVDYVKKLQSEQEVMKRLEVKITELGTDLRKIAAKLERFEAQPDTNLNDRLDINQTKTTPIHVQRLSIDSMDMGQNENFHKSKQWPLRRRVTSLTYQPNLEEWNILSPVVIGDSRNHLSSSPTFSDTLSNYL